MDYKTILFEKRDGIAYLILNRPEALNAISVDLATEFANAIEHCSQDDDINVVIITGAGTAFCSGGDVKPMSVMAGPSDRARYLGELVRSACKMILGIRNLRKPVIGAINGVAAGGGVALALAPDIVIASEEARFTVAYVNIGLCTDIGTSFFLTRLVGYHKAAELIFTSDFVDAHEALRLNLVNKVVSRKALPETVEELATRLGRKPSVALAHCKELINKALFSTLEAQIELETQSILQACLTEDHGEGLTALFEKRDAVFKGK